MEYGQIVVDFIEGRISYSEFFEMVMNDDGFADWIDQQAPSDWQCHTKATKENHFQPENLPFSLRRKIDEYAWGSSVMAMGVRRNVHDLMTRFARAVWEGIELHPVDTYKTQNELLLSACPLCIDGEEVWASGFMEKLLAECPEEGSKSNKIKFVKTRIKEEFHLEDKRYPRWLQNPKWPFWNGAPMKFVKTTVKVKGEWLQHHFVDPETGTERIVDDVL